MILLRVGNMTFRTDDAMVELFPDGAVWVERDFPDANMLILPGESPAVMDTGFVASADATAALVSVHLPRVARVANTH